MRTLVIETATAACSAALLEDGEVIAERHEVVGRGHAERLIPMIAELPGEGRADRIRVDCGPGSFTGVRVGLAAARALGIGWGAQVAGFSSVALVAAAAFDRLSDSASVAVVLEGGHGEVFFQRFASPLRAIAPLESLRPAEALAALNGAIAVGSGVDHLVALDPTVRVERTLPRAADLRLMPAEMTNLPPSPVYGRAPDAKPKG